MDWQLHSPDAPELRQRDPEADRRLGTRPAFLFFRLAKRAA